MYMYDEHVYILGIKERLQTKEKVIKEFVEEKI